LNNVHDLKKKSGKKVDFYSVGYSLNQLQSVLIRSALGTPYFTPTFLQPRLWRSQLLLNCGQLKVKRFYGQPKGER
jgi:hypothetical protein